VLFKMSIDITLNRVLRKNRYDFIYMRSSASGSYVAKISKIYDIPLVLEVNKPQSMGPYNNCNSLAWPSSKKDVYVSDNERIQYEIASVITVDSTLRGKWITEFVDANMRDKIVVNPNAVNSDMFKPCDDVQDIKQLYHIDLARLIVGMASSFRWYNDKEEFFEIIRKTIFNNNRILFLLIVGDSTQYRLLKKMVHRYGFDNNVMLLEKVPFSKMPKVLNMCDILISHFNFHGVWPHNCSIKHLEYLAMGKPVVATNVGEVNFAIENNVNGVLITEGDVDNFSSAIIKLSHDGNMRKKYGANGRIKAEQKLTWENNVNKILSQLF